MYSTNEFSISPSLLAIQVTKEEYSISPFHLKIPNQWTIMNYTGDTFLRLIIANINFKSSILTTRVSSLGKRVIPNHLSIKHKVGN
jgi:hypothetical protein